MSDGDCLLRAILHNPADDDPRLQYADWLDDHGEPDRAEFICKSVGFGEYENGWTLQPHVHHPHKHLFRVTGLEDHQYLYRRGFVDEVRCTVAALFGGPCGRCGGDGRAHGADRPFEWSADVDYGKCVICKGTGRTEGIGSAVAAAHPVTRVVVTDREPVQARTEFVRLDEWRWFRHRPGTVIGGGDLPTEAFDRLAGGVINAGNWCRYYPTRETAQAALSAALVAWARGQT